MNEFKHLAFKRLAHNTFVDAIESANAYFSGAKVRPESKAAFVSHMKNFEPDIDNLTLIDLAKQLKIADVLRDPELAHKRVEETLSFIPSFYVIQLWSNRLL